MCSLVGSILHTAIQLEKHPLTPPQPPKLNKENGSIRSEVSVPWKELSVENVSGKNQTVSTVPVKFSSWIVSGDKKKRRPKNLKPISGAGLYMQISCKYNMTLTVIEYNKVQSKQGWYISTNVCSSHFNCTPHMILAESRGHTRLSDLFSSAPLWSGESKSSK